MRDYRWFQVSSLKLRFEPAHDDFIDLERDSAIRVRALMALAAYSVRQCLNKFIIALAQSQVAGFRFEIVNYEL